MPRYIILNLKNGKVDYVESDKAPIPKRDQIVYDESIFKIKPGIEGSDILQANDISKKYKHSLDYVMEQNIGEYGKGLFAQKNVSEHTLYLPYVGLYISVNGKEKYPDHLKSPYDYQVGTADDHASFICLTKENLCYVHSAQHLSSETKINNKCILTRMNDDACTENLAPSVSYCCVKLDDKQVYLNAGFSANNLFPFGAQPYA